MQAPHSHFYISACREAHNRSLQALKRLEETDGLDWCDTRCWIEPAAPAAPADADPRERRAVDLSELGLEPKVCYNEFVSGKIVERAVFVPWSGVRTVVQFDDGRAAVIELRRAVRSWYDDARVAACFPVGSTLTLMDPEYDLLEDDDPYGDESFMLGFRSSHPSRTSVSREALWSHVARTSKDLRLHGNNLTSAGDLEGALEAYVAAAALDEKDAASRSNAAEVCLRLGQFARGVELAEAALVRDAAHFKSIVRLGKCMLGLHDYASAVKVLKRVEDAAHLKDADFQKVVRTAEDLLQQSIDGRVAFPEPPLSSVPSLANYISEAIEVRTSLSTDASAGRGLFVTRDVPAGETLLICNPLALGVVPARFALASHHVRMELKHRDLFACLALQGPGATKAAGWMRSMCSVHYDEDSEEFTCTTPEMLLSPRESLRAYARRVESAPPPPAESWRDDRGAVEANTFGSSRFTALCGPSSLLNARCADTNVTIIDLGTVSVIKASRRIRAEEELYTRYVEAYDANRATRTAMLMEWGITSCECPLCVQELKHAKVLDVCSEDDPSKLESLLSRLASSPTELAMLRSSRLSTYVGGAFREHALACRRVVSPNGYDLMWALLKAYQNHENTEQIVEELKQVLLVRYGRCDDAFVGKLVAYQRQSGPSPRRDPDSAGEWTEASAYARQFDAKHAYVYPS